MRSVFKSLQSFQSNKSPGNDGLTVEFYNAFWESLGKLLVDSLNCSFDKGELSNSQKQAIITLIEKKDKDKRKISNWRPISLINVDVKIGSKAIALRLQTVLPRIIHQNQHAYVKGRTINYAIRTIDDILVYTERYGINGKMLAIDFQKAFDSVNRNFLFSTLAAFNFQLALRSSSGYKPFTKIFQVVFLITKRCEARRSTLSILVHYCPRSASC